jgi:hypothetical protein
MNFLDAIAAAEDGPRTRIYRRAWREAAGVQGAERFLFVFLGRGDDLFNHLWETSVSGNRVEYISQTPSLGADDLLADDWEIARAYGRESNRDHPDRSPVPSVN